MIIGKLNQKQHAKIQILNSLFILIRKYYRKLKKKKKHDKKIPLIKYSLVKKSKIKELLNELYLLKYINPIVIYKFISNYHKGNIKNLKSKYFPLILFVYSSDTSEYSGILSPLRAGI